MAPNKRKSCPFCTHETNSMQRLRLHLSQRHYCYHCDKNVPDPRHHVCIPGAGTVQTAAGSLEHSMFRLVEVALNNTFKTYSLVLGDEVRFVSVETLFSRYNEEMAKVLRN